MTDLFGGRPRAAPGWQKRRGKAAVDNGKIFENTFKAMVSLSGVTVTQMPSGCRRVGKTIIPVKTACDWILSWNGSFALIDTKTINDSVFPHSLITPHQAYELSLHESQGVKAGYVVELRKTGSVVFIPSSLLIKRMRQGPGSIGPNDDGVITLGTSQKFDVRILVNAKDKER